MFLTQVALLAALAFVNPNPSYVQVFSGTIPYQNTINGHTFDTGTYQSVSYSTIQIDGLTHFEDDDGWYDLSYFNISYNNYTVRYFHIQYSSVDEMFLIDYDFGGGDYPYINYYLSATVYQYDYYTGQDRVYNGNTIINLMYDTNEIFIDTNSNFHEDLTFYLTLNFYFMPQDAYEYFVQSYFGGDSSQAFNNGYQSGLADGQVIGYGDGYSAGESAGYLTGYSDGRQSAIEQGATASIIFNGIISVGLLPVNVFLKILNFEVFGINIGAFVSSLLTIMVIITIIRTFMGGKNGE